MQLYPPAIYELIKRLSELPTIGPKTAERIIFMLLKKNNNEILALGNNLIELSKKIKRCSRCNNFSDTNPCHICSDPHRNQNLLCIVSEPPDLAAIERTGHFDGLYFVLNGHISTYHGTTPADIKIPELLAYIQQNQQINEIVLAFNQDVEGETTGLYLAKELKKINKKTSRLARGLPMGADVEYADEITLSAALDNRKEL